MNLLAPADPETRTSKTIWKSGLCLAEIFGQWGVAEVNQEIPMHSDTNNIVEIDRDAFDELMDQSEPVADDVLTVEPAPSETMAESSFEAAPSVDLAPPAPSIPRLRAQLHAFKRDLTGLQSAISVVNEKSTDISPLIRNALAAIAAGGRIPPEDPDEPVLLKWQKQAPTSKLISFRAMALEEIDAQLEIVNKAQVSLQTLDAFDKPALSNWSNLPPQKLARAINAHAHLIFSNAIVR